MTLDEFIKRADEVEAKTDFVVSWSGPNGFNSTNFDILDVPPAIYELSIECVDNTSPVFGCSFESTIIVPSPEPFNITGTYENCNYSLFCKIFS